LFGSRLSGALFSDHGLLVCCYPLLQAEACLSLDVEMPDKLPTKVAAAAGADDWEPSAEPAAAAPPDAPYVDALHRGWLAEVDEHMIRRSNILRQQLRRWWHKIGGAVSSGTDGDSTM
jgi:hypothetical protein